MVLLGAWFARGLRTLDVRPGPLWSHDQLVLVYLVLVGRGGADILLGLSILGWDP